MTRQTGTSRRRPDAAEFLILATISFMFAIVFGLIG